MPTMTADERASKALAAIKAYFDALDRADALWLAYGAAMSRMTARFNRLMTTNIPLYLLQARRREIVRNGRMMRWMIASAEAKAAFQAYLAATGAAQ